MALLWWFGALSLNWLYNFWCLFWHESLPNRSSFWSNYWLIFASFFCPIFGAISGASFGLFSCILHLFSDFFLLFTYVCMFLHKFWCNFLVPLLACFFFAFCIFFVFLLLIVILGHIFGLRLAIFNMELSWAFLFNVCLMGFMFGHSVAQMIQTLCFMMFATFI